MITDKLDNETILVRQMQTGNEGAFTILYNYYSPRLYVNIYRMIHDAEMTEEIVQELFTRIWHKRESIGIKENFTGYMYRIAQNLVHDCFRKIKNDKKLIEKFQLLVEESYEQIEETLYYHQSADILNKALKQLSPQQRKVYHFVREEGYTYKQAAALMGISPHTVKEYLIAATKSIKKYIIHYSGNESLVVLLILTGCYM
jgi:RNA polymerase sigma factor, sigma-70 family